MAATVAKAAILLHAAAVAAPATKARTLPVTPT
jgi:hypothetical protein